MCIRDSCIGGGIKEMSRQQILYEFNDRWCSFCPYLGDVRHHISYFPEVTILVCKYCHGRMRTIHPELCPSDADYRKFYGKGEIIQSKGTASKREKQEGIVTYGDYRNAHKKEVERLRVDLEHLLKSDMDLLRIKLEKYTKRKDQTILRIVYGKGKIKKDEKELDRDLYEHELLLDALCASEKKWHENNVDWLKEKEND